MILIGAEVKSGEFTDPKTGNTIIYDNLVCYFQSAEPLDNPENENFSFGLSCKAYKIKNSADSLKSAFKGFYKDDDSGQWLKDLVGVNLEIIENKYGGIQRVLLE